MIEVKSDCEHDKFGYIPIEDSSILQKIFDLLVQVEQTQVEDCGSLEFELSLQDSIELFLHRTWTVYGRTMSLSFADNIS